jgi:hypothetical protein
MIKQFIILAQLLGLFFYQLFFTVDLTVTQKLQSSIVQGEEAIVEITIDKADLPGFAKVQQSFPDGFTAEPIETKGATFSFKDNKLKFIWMSLPEEKVFTISYKIVADETVEGDFSLGGKFSFISESERKNVDIPVSSFKVVKKAPEAIAVVSEMVEEEVAEEVVVVEEPEIEEEEVAEIEEEPVVEAAIQQEPVVEEVVAEVAAKQESKTLVLGTIMCKRTIIPTTKGKYNVTIEVSKKDVEGFCKITEKIPTGFVATEDNSNNGVFSFKDNTMKILWMGAPKEDVYTVSYNLEALPETENGKYDIIGFYSYLENDATSKYIIDGTSFNLEQEEAIEELIVEEPVIVTPPKEVVAGVTKEEGEVVAEEKAVEKVVQKPEVQEEGVTSTPSPEGDVTYKVQVGAGHKKVPSTYFATVFKLQDKVSTINHEGWIKYLVGSYDAYKAARDKRNVVRGNVKTAFVTAYNSGTRITVQEALMISNQKWYK